MLIVPRSQIRPELAEMSVAIHDLLEENRKLRQSLESYYEGYKQYQRKYGPLPLDIADDNNIPIE